MHTMAVLDLIAVQIDAPFAVANYCTCTVAQAVKARRINAQAASLTAINCYPFIVLRFDYISRINRSELLTNRLGMDRSWVGWNHAVLSWPHGTLGTRQQRVSNCCSLRVGANCLRVPVPHCYRHNWNSTCALPSVLLRTRG